MSDHNLPDVELDQLDPDTFKYVSGVYDRFTHILLCDLDHKCVSIVTYMYARNIASLRNRMHIVPLSQYPDLAQYAVKNELLCMTVRDTKRIASFIEKQANTLAVLHGEFIELQCLNMLNSDTLEPLVQKIKIFLKSIKVGSYDGDGIFWLPENYGHEGENLDRNENETEEDYMRRSICTHIKSRRLPMAHIIPASEAENGMFTELITGVLAQQYTAKLSRLATVTHFAPIFRNRKHITGNCLQVLIAEEFRCVKNEDKINGDGLFIFNSYQLDQSEATIPTERALNNLRYYVGDYLEHLDLKLSFITGSAISAAIIKTDRDSDYNDHDRETSIDLLYPKVISTLNEADRDHVRNDNINSWNINVLTETTGVMTKGATQIHFTIKSGSDVDIAIDNTVSDAEYRAIAADHFAVIQRYCPYVKIREYTKPKGDWNYVIYTDNPTYISVFRVVEIYRSSFKNICSHHVGAVRGCYTARWSAQPQFYLTASAVLTSMLHATPNYHYFAGRKSNPQDIILKNMQRGIGISDERLREMVYDYFSRNHITLSQYPFYEGEGVPYSIFMAPLEYSLRFPQDRDRTRRRHRNNRHTRAPVQTPVRPIVSRGYTDDTEPEIEPPSSPQHSNMGQLPPIDRHLPIWDTPIDRHLRTAVSIGQVNLTQMGGSTSTQSQSSQVILPSPPPQPMFTRRDNVNQVTEVQPYAAQLPNVRGLLPAISRSIPLRNYLLEQPQPASESEHIARDLLPPGYLQRDDIDQPLLETPQANRIHSEEIPNCSNRVEKIPLNLPPIQPLIDAETIRSPFHVPMVETNTLGTGKISAHKIRRESEIEYE